MTLIVSLITRDHALQVSDRRLVDLAPGGFAGLILFVARQLVRRSMS